MENENADMVEHFVDCASRRRTFRLFEVAEGLFLEAHEIPKGERSGLRFVLPAKAGEGLPWAELRRAIRARLSERSVAYGPDGQLQILADTVRGQLSERNAEPENASSENALSVVIDDLEISWDTLGKLLRPYIGSGIRIELKEPGEE